MLDSLSRNGSSSNGSVETDAQARLPDSLRQVLTGGAPVPARLMARLAAAAPSAAVLGVYGATELLPAAVVDAATKVAYHGEGDLVGTPLPGVTVAIGGAAIGGAAIGGAAIGGEDEVLLDGPHRFEGHLTADGVVAQAPVRTGDAGRLAPVTATGTGTATATATGAQGVGPDRLVLVGRLKDMIIRGSMNIYPGLYEPALQEVPGVLDCALVGVPDPETGDERVVLAVVTQPPAAPDAVLSAVRRRLPQLMDAAALPDDVVQVAGLPGLPRSGRSAKPDRSALVEMLRDHPAPSPDGSRTDR